MHPTLRKTPLPILTNPLSSAASVHMCYQDNAIHALTVRLLDPLVMTTVHCLLKEAAAAAAAAAGAMAPSSTTTSVTTSTTAAVGMGGGRADDSIQPTSTTTSTDLAVTTIVPLNTTTTTLPSHPRLLPHLRPHSSVGLSLTAFEAALAINMRLLAHSPAAPGTAPVPRRLHKNTINAYIYPFS